MKNIIIGILFLFACSTKDSSTKNIGVEKNYCTINSSALVRKTPPCPVCEVCQTCPQCEECPSTPSPIHTTLPLGSPMYLTEGTPISPVFSMDVSLSNEGVTDHLPGKKWQFKSTDLLLYVHTVLNGINCGHLLTLDFVMPDGFYYKHRTIKFTAGSLNGCVLQGYPWEYVLAEEYLEGNIISTNIPIAASQIATLSIFGNWHLVVYLDDDPVPATIMWFEITQ